MTASWPAFIVGAALVFLVFNAIFAFLYWIGFHWIGDQPISNVSGGAYIDYFYFSIETLSTAGYGDMHPQTTTAISSRPSSSSPASSRCR
jgi:inward rectifier potassium channel